MNELLQKHGCSNVFTIPEGLRELMADISREVLREQPVKICDFIANYLSALLITREHGVLAIKILDDLCDCRPTVSEHLIKSGMPAEEAAGLSQIIKEEIENSSAAEGKEKIKEAEIIKKILKRSPLDEETTATVCQIARNAYRDYWYRKKMLEQEMKEPKNEEPWEKAAAHTLEIYKKTRPSFSELTRATLKIQAAYRGYHVRKQMLGHVKPKKKQAPKVDLFGPPVDIGDSRKIDLGPVVDIKEKVKMDDMSLRFTEKDNKNLGLDYDTTKTITNLEPGGESQVVKKIKKPGMSQDRTPKNTVLTSIVDIKRAQIPQVSTEVGLQPSPHKIPDHDGEDELPLAPEPKDMELVTEDRRISFGPSKEIAVSEIPEDLPPMDFSDVPASYDTNSVPTSAATTAPTSEIEDLATSGAEEAEEE